MYAVLLCDLDLICNLAIVTMTLYIFILSGLLFNQGIAQSTIAYLKDSNSILAYLHTHYYISFMLLKLFMNIS